MAVMDDELFGNQLSEHLVNPRTLSVLLAIPS